MIESQLREYLLSVPEIKTVLGNRLYPGWFPEDVKYPAAAYLEISGVAHHDIRVSYPRYQFSCFSTRYGEAREIAALIRAALQRYKGNMGGIRVVQGVWMGSRDLYEEDTKLYHIATDFKIIYRE